MECPYCGLPLERETLENGKVVMACPNCNYYKETGELAPNPTNDWREE